MRDLKDLPRNSAVRKINELVKRVRLSKVHAYIIAHLKEQMPVMMGHAKKQAALIDTLPQVFRSVMKKYNLAPGDFPDIADFQSKLAEMDFTRFSGLKQKYIDDAEQVMSAEFPRLMEALPRSLDSYPQNSAPPSNVPLIYTPNVPDPPPTSAPTKSPKGGTTPPAWGADGDGGSAEPVMATAQVASGDECNPWDEDEPAADDGWALSEYVAQYKPEFDAVQKGGKVSGGAAKKVLGSSGLPTTQLREIWNLADVDGDGQLDEHEFVVAMFLVAMVKQGHGVPAQLDPEMLPPGK
jgi:hypothetical protein